MGEIIPSHSIPVRLKGGYVAIGATVLILRILRQKQRGNASSPLENGRKIFLQFPLTSLETETCLCLVSPFVAFP
ncbi:hypothetical protein TNCT_211581 [Trichonephila clavata]|uniref:Uncharacterized protein n=1 Tax=Trichonephila clavata TaxID=2740835 RepID=A0A8X6L6Z7_TRICU|nr:hypothetical protein TNCT_211581 [Trichonephila clavata]